MTKEGKGKEAISFLASNHNGALEMRD